MLLDQIRGFEIDAIVPAGVANGASLVMEFPFCRIFLFAVGIDSLLENISCRDSRTGMSHQGAINKNISFVFFSQCSGQFSEIDEPSEGDD